MQIRHGQGRRGARAEEQNRNHHMLEFHNPLNL
jgi:hypothetical protein